MRNVRLFSPVALSANVETELGSYEANYVFRVLRLDEGAAITLFDGRGGEYDAEIVAVSKRLVRFRVLRHRNEEHESPLRTTLIQGLPRAERMDFLVQKATELGVSRIEPVITQRSSVGPGAERAKKRQARWRSIAISACQQCGRNRIPEIGTPVPLEELIDACRDDSLKLILLPDAATTLAAHQPVGRAITLLIGPEGGWSDREIAHSGASGYRAVSLGPRTLRTETAALAALAIVQATCGDMR